MEREKLLELTGNDTKKNIYFRGYYHYESKKQAQISTTGDKKVIFKLRNNKAGVDTDWYKNCSSGFTCENSPGHNIFIDSPQNATDVFVIEASNMDFTYQPTDD
jgi:hypothetical protein